MANAVISSFNTWLGSAVGVNSEIICHGVNGYLANTNEDWVVYLATLIDDAALRYRMGLNGREQVEDFYCVQKIGHKYIKNFSLS